MKSLNSVAATTAAAIVALQRLDGHLQIWGSAECCMSTRRALDAIVRQGWCAEVRAYARRLGWPTGWQP